MRMRFMSASLQMIRIVALSIAVPGCPSRSRARLCGMKLGIIGTGNVGCAVALAAVARGSAREIVLVNRTRKTAQAVATDMRYGTPLSPRVDISDGDYDALAGAGVVLITSGVNEKTGGATDRNDPQGRLRLR